MLSMRPTAGSRCGGEEGRHALDGSPQVRLFGVVLCRGPTGPIKIGKWITLPPTGRRIQTPMHLSSIVWNPDGKIVLSVHLSTDRPLRGQH